MWDLNFSQKQVLEKGQSSYILTYIYDKCVYMHLCGGLPVVDSPSADVVWPGCILWSPGRLVSGKPRRGSGYRFQ